MTLGPDRVYAEPLRLGRGGAVHRLVNSDAVREIQYLFEHCAVTRIEHHLGAQLSAQFGAVGDVLDRDDARLPR